MPIQRRQRRFYTETLEQRLLLTANELVPFSFSWGNAGDLAVDLALIAIVELDP